MPSASIAAGTTRGACLQETLPTLQGFASGDGLHAMLAHEHFVRGSRDFSGALVSLEAPRNPVFTNADEPPKEVTVEVALGLRNQVDDDRPRLQQASPWFGAVSFSDLVLEIVPDSRASIATCDWQ